MQSYIELILEDLGNGETPKKCYENLQVLYEENYHMKAQIKTYSAVIKALKEQPDETVLGSIKNLLG